MDDLNFYFYFLDFFSHVFRYDVDEFVAFLFQIILSRY